MMISKDFRHNAGIIPSVVIIVCRAVLDGGTFRARVRVPRPEDTSSRNEIFLKGDFVMQLSRLCSLYSALAIHRISPFSSIGGF